MEGLRAGRISTGSRSEMLNHHHFNNNNNNNNIENKRTTLVKMFNKVQVVYYLTRNGHLEHPHYLEVSHLATQPLRLRDVIERLTVLRGKAIASQYSWSCKRSYKSGYVWNDLSENDAIYASEGSEYVLKGSELVQLRDISEIKAQEFELKGRKEATGNQVKPKSLVSFRQTEKAKTNLQGNHNEDEDEDDEEEDKGSCNNSSNPLIAQMEQDESCSLPSTSSTNSDRPPPPPKTPIQTCSTLSNKVKVEKDIDPCGLTRNTVLLQLIACGGGSMGPKSKLKPKPKPNSFNFNSMRSSIMPCLKHQLSAKRATITDSSDTDKVISVTKDHCSCKCKSESRREDEEDEDMIMVKFMSENPRFGNQQSQEKEYFSGTIVETMGTHHQHTPSSGSASNLPNSVFTKSSSYNEQRSSKSVVEEEAKDEEKEKGVKVKRIIKCIPRRKSYGSNSSKI